MYVCWRLWCVGEWEWEQMELNSCVSMRWYWHQLHVSHWREFGYWRSAWGNIFVPLSWGKPQHPPWINVDLCQQHDWHKSMLICAGRSGTVPGKGVRAWEGVRSGSDHCHHQTQLLLIVSAVRSNFRVQTSSCSSMKTNSHTMLDLQDWRSQCDFVPISIRALLLGELGLVLLLPYAIVLVQIISQSCY